MTVTVMAWVEGLRSFAHASTRSFRCGFAFSEACPCTEAACTYEAAEWRASKPRNKADDPHGDLAITQLI